MLEQYPKNSAPTNVTVSTSPQAAPISAPLCVDLATLSRLKNAPIKQDDISVEIVPQRDLSTVELVVELKRASSTARLVIHAESLAAIRDPAQQVILYFPGLEGHVENPFCAILETPQTCHASFDPQFQSSRAKYDIKDIESFVNAGKLAVDWLCRERGSSVSICGFSFGGYLALRLAEDCGPKIDSVSLLSPSVVTRGWATVIGGVILPIVNTLSKSWNFLCRLGGGTRPDFMSTETVRTLRAILNPDKHEGLFKKITVPIQILIGSKEPYSTKYLQKLLELSVNPDKELLTVPGEGHTPYSPDRLSSALEFLGRHSTNSRISKR